VITEAEINRSTTQTKTRCRPNGT